MMECLVDAKVFGELLRRDRYLRARDEDGRGLTARGGRKNWKNWMRRRVRLAREVRNG